MWIHKFFVDPQSLSDPLDEGAELVSATLEPTASHTAEEILQQLRGSGAEVHLLTGNTISVTGSRETLDRVSEAADVHVNPYQRLSDKYL